MDGIPDLLACITDDSGLLFLSGCNKTVVPRWLYASCWWRHGVVAVSTAGIFSFSIAGERSLSALHYSSRGKARIFCKG